MASGADIHLIYSYSKEGYLQRMLKYPDNNVSNTSPSPLHFKLYPDANMGNVARNGQDKIQDVNVTNEL